MLSLLSLFNSPFFIPLPHAPLLQTCLSDSIMCHCLTWPQGSSALTKWKQISPGREPTGSWQSRIFVELQPKVQLGNMRPDRIQTSRWTLVSKKATHGLLYMKIIGETFLIYMLCIFLLAVFEYVYWKAYKTGIFCTVSVWGHKTKVLLISRNYFIMHLKP